MSVKDYGTKATVMELNLSGARVDYMMRNPTGFLLIGLVYDPFGVGGRTRVFLEALIQKIKFI